MALTVIKPSGLDTSGNFTVNGMNVSANASIANLTITTSSNLGAVGNIYIGGGTTGQYLQTDGSGVLTWSTISVNTASISNGNSNVNIPSSNGNINLTAVGNTTMVVTGTGANIAGTLNVTGNTVVGNLVTSGSGGNITNANVISANTFTASGNITANIVTASNGLTVTSGALTVSNGNLDVTGNLNVTGNVNYSNVTDLVVGDPLIFIGANNPGDSYDLGIVASYVVGTTYHTGLARNASNDTWTFFDGVVAEPNTVIDWANATYPNVKLGNLLSTGNITAGNANLGNTVTANYFAGTLTTAAQPNITSIGTLTGLTSTGVVDLTGASNTSLGPVGNVHITGGTNGQYLQTDGSGVLTWSTISVSTASISNGNSNVNIPSANGNVNISAVGNANVVVITGTGANIAGTLNVTGNTTVANLVTSGSGGNITNANVISANTFTASGNISAGNANLGNAVTANYLAGTLTTAAQPNITSLGTLTSIVVSGTSNLGPVGNVTITGGSNGQYLQTNGSGVLTWSTVATGSASNISNGNSNVNIPDANGNVNISAVGNANVVVITGTGVNIAGTLNTTGNVTVGNIITSGSGGNISNANVISANTFTASGNITASNANLGNAVSANYFIGNFYGTANLATYATTANSVAGANVSGQVGNALIAGTVYTNAQPNITSVGTLTSLDVTGNAGAGNLNTTGTANIGTLAVTGTSNLGPVGNVTITGGSNGQYLQTNGSGVLSWSTVATGSASNISNGNSNVNIPSANGNINLTAVGNTTMVVTGTGVNIAGTLNATGNVTVGNIITSGSGGNISNANVISANTITASANLNGADLSLSGNGVFGGNLTVNGTLTYINSTTLSISDPIINLQTGANGAAPTSNSGKDVGTALNYYDTSAKIAWMGWDVSNAEISFASNVGITAEVVTFTSLANIRSGNASLGNTVTANYFVGDLYGTANTAGTVTTASQPNITSTGTLTSLTVSGTSNLGAVGNITITGGSNGYVLSTDGSGNLSWISTSGPSSNIVLDSFTGNGVQTVFTLTSTPTSEDYTLVNIDGVSQLHSDYSVSGATLTLSSAPVSGAKVEVMIFNLAGSGGGGGGGGSNIANGTSNVSIATSNGNITASVGGNANVVVVTGTGVNVAGTIAGTQLTSNIATGTAPFVVTSTTQVANLSVATAGLATYATTANAVAGANVSGAVGLATYATTANAVAGANVSGTVANATYATSAGSATSATTAGTVTTAAQPNITSLGTIANLTATNVNFTAFKETVVAGGSVSGTLTPNVAAGTIYNYTLSGDITINALGNAVAGSSAVLILTQDATGSRLLTSTMKFAGNSKTLSTTGASIDIMTVFYDGTTYYATLSKGYA